ncbi:hypothetical protein NLJ89_g5130 [Agrocybe chaxingu]|uniref:DUF6534 domain-containing protein n=1 Tax=Agrocybe chaxingu TaxID=84603 RepID=A0A9W8K0S6_9AGAR|nr:hypothetical protein NLJ89_g5130 [Agrocybe chaxingu]
MSDAPASPPVGPGIPPDIGRVAGPLASVATKRLKSVLMIVLAAWVYVKLVPSRRALSSNLYYLSFPKDPTTSRVLVFGVFIFETVQTLLLTENAFSNFASGFGDLRALDRIGLIWFTIPIMSGIVAFVTQTFYAYRIKILAQNNIAPAFIMLFAFVQLGGAIATGVKSKAAVVHSRFVSRESLITTGLSHRDAGWGPTQKIVRKLTRLVIETGSLTATVALVNFALALLPGHPTYYQTAVGVLGKLYSNSMMAVFNSRIRLSHSPDTYSNASSHISYRRRTSLTELGSEIYPIDGTKSQRQDDSTLGVDKPRDLVPNA